MMGDLGMMSSIESWTRCCRAAKRRRLHVRWATIMAVLFAGTGGALAEDAPEYRGTLQQRLACTPDVWRLCSAEIPHVARIVACLERKKSQLNKDCHAVFADDADAAHETKRAPASKTPH